MHDVLDLSDLVPDEAEQLTHSGQPAAGLLVAARGHGPAHLTALAEVGSL